MSSMPTIAVNVMVKNAKEAVIRALRSIVHEVDEIVVFDTGSTDGTQAAVQAYLAELPDSKIKTFKEVPWVDDFSAIRNQMIEASVSDWIIALDSDEVLTVTERTLHDLTVTGHVVFFIEKRSYVKRRDIPGSIAVKGEFPAQEAGYAAYVSEPNYLFFKKTPEVRYRRLIHETIEPSLILHKIPSVRVNHVVIHNYGRHDMSAKGVWYRSLVEKMVAQTPEDGMAWRYLGMHEKDDGNFAQAVACFDRCLRLMPEHATAKLLRAQCLIELQRYAEAEQALLDLASAIPQEEVVWLTLLDLAEHDANAGEAISRWITQAESSGHASFAVYETAAKKLMQLNKRVKADMYRKKARDLKKRSA